MEVGGQIHTLATLTPGETAPSTHLIGGCVGPTASLDVVAKRKTPCPFQDLNPSHLTHSLVTNTDSAMYKLITSRTEDIHKYNAGTNFIYLNY
jgi:hypothetical protein